MTDEERKKFLNIHLPYRMTHLDGFIWANETQKKYDLKKDVFVEIENENKSTIPLWTVTNPLIEAGLITCRIISQFLGMRLEDYSGGNSTKGALARAYINFNYKPPVGEHFIERLDARLSHVNEAEFDALENTLLKGLRSAFIETYYSATKASAHFTQTDSAVSNLETNALCANALLILVESKIYKTLGWDLPHYKWWTEPGPPN